MKKREFLNEKQIEAKCKKEFGVDITVLSKIRDKKKGITIVRFICPIHGEKELQLGRILKVGCSSCHHDKIIREKEKTVCGVGFCDIYVKGKEKHACYVAWHAMLQRCYDKKLHKRLPNYQYCSVCEEWKLFSNFYEWWKRNYVEGYSLDKDLLKKGNTIYSPETCVYLPITINSLLSKTQKSRGNLPIGVQWYKSKGKYLATMSYHSLPKYLGLYDNPLDAFKAYKTGREAYLKEIAEEYKNVIDIRAYNALMNYQVDIND